MFVSFSDLNSWPVVSGHPKVRLSRSGAVPRLSTKSGVVAQLPHRSDIRFGRCVVALTDSLHRRQVEQLSVDATVQVPSEINTRWVHDRISENGLL